MKRGRLVLEDGSIFEGDSFGFEGACAGEVVFTTGMMGYPESLTDPSFCGQILVSTYPMVGNYGVPASGFESDKIHIRGLIVSDYSADYSHWNAVQSLGSWLIANKVPGLTGIDTRELTKKLREHGVMKGKIVFDKDIDFEDISTVNLVSLVSCKDKIVYGSGLKKVLLVDCGVKENIIRCFVKRGVTVIRVPWDYDFSSDTFDGLFISNGPGDPKMCDVTIKNIKNAFSLGKPIFGICLGSQLLALAAGADTYKLKYGHRGQNQPCVVSVEKKCYITSQNHGYAVDEESLSSEWEAWFTNINDGTNEGIRHKSKPFFSVQFHPEAAPGPEDTEFLFDDFVRML